MSYEINQRDNLRPEKMCEVDIDCAVNSLVIGGGAGKHGAANAKLLYQGQNKVKVYESDLPGILELVEPNPEKIQHAKDWVEEEKQYRFEQALEHVAGDLNESAKQAARREAYKGVGSWQARFIREMRRSPKPLRSAVVVQENLLPPQSYEAALQSLQAEWLEKEKARLALAKKKA